jgi:2-dehydro-3-deoxyphosphogluconate aldolase / (4S)-4-hydroxy-2-oxoglutarate aldolase
MNNSFQITDKIGTQGVLPLFYHGELAVCIALTDALYRAGIRVIEFTNRGPAAMDNFKALIDYRDQHWAGLLLGIGTIKTAQQAIDFSAANADFLVSPAYLPSIAETAGYLGKLWIPGCMTPSEIAAAEQSGARVIKLFPGNLLGPEFVKAIRELFPDISFMPTGGVTPVAENLQQWFSSGVFAVGMGSQLISKSLLQQRDYSRIEVDTANLLQMVQAIRNPENKPAV